MPLTENEIKNILSLDDARLREVIMQIAAATGADMKKAAYIAGDPGAIRSKLQGMSADDINRLLDKAGREKSEQVLDSLRGQ